MYEKKTKKKGFAANQQTKPQPSNQTMIHFYNKTAKFENVA